ALARGRPLDLEHATRHGGLRIAMGTAQELLDPGEELDDADPMRGRAEVDRMDQPRPSLDGELIAQVWTGQRPPVADVGPEDRLVVLGEHFRGLHPMRL